MKVYDPTRGIVYLFIFILQIIGGESVDLKTFWDQNPKSAIAFSGGVDSTYLLYTALHYGVDVNCLLCKICVSATI